MAKVKDVDPRAELMKKLVAYYSGLIGHQKPMPGFNIRAGQSPLRTMGRDMAMQRAASGGPAGYGRVESFLSHFLGGGGGQRPPMDGGPGGGGNPAPRPMGPQGGGGIDIPSILAMLRGGGGGMPPQQNRIPEGRDGQAPANQGFMASPNNDPRYQY